MGMIFKKNKNQVKSGKWKKEKNELWNLQESWEFSMQSSILTNLIERNEVM